MPIEMLLVTSEMLWVTSVTQSLRTLDDSVEHAGVIPTMGLDAEMIIGIYQPSLWLFVHQTSYPSAQSLDEGSHCISSLIFPTCLELWFIILYTQTKSSGILPLYSIHSECPWRHG